MQHLESYPWPGNIRELENMMERAAALSRGSAVTPDQLPRDVCGTTVSAAPTRPGEAPPPERLALEPQVEALERGLIEAVLRRTGDNKSAAARLLEISERFLWYKPKKYRG